MENRIDIFTHLQILNQITVFKRLYLVSTNEISWDQTFLLWIYHESFVSIMQKEVGSFIFCNINEIFFSSTISELNVHRDTIKYIYLWYLFCEPRHVSGSEIHRPYLLAISPSVRKCFELNRGSKRMIRRADVVQLRNQLFQQLKLSFREQRNFSFFSLWYNSLLDLTPWDGKKWLIIFHSDLHLKFHFRT